MAKAIKTRLTNKPVKEQKEASPVVQATVLAAIFVIIFIVFWLLAPIIG